METKLYAAYLAGHCMESTAWRMLKEVAGQAIEAGAGVAIGPYSVIIGDESRFVLAQTADRSQDGFEAPEATSADKRTAESQVWSLAATIFYMMMGCQVMNGKGGKGQHERSKIPYLRSELPELSELLQQCLQYNPAKRPSMAAIERLAEAQYERCLNEIRRGPKLKPASHPASAAGQLGRLDTWPEQMIDLETKE